jgi:hypothetical protein
MAAVYAKEILLVIPVAIITRIVTIDKVNCSYSIYIYYYDIFKIYYNSL